MEYAARLGLMEQNVKNTDKFSKILYELWKIIRRILDSPPDSNVRIIRSDFLINAASEIQTLKDFLSYIGLQEEERQYIYVKQLDKNHLKFVIESIERKIYYCTGTSCEEYLSMTSIIVKKYKYTPANILISNNPLLRKIQSSFNFVLKYEDECIQAEARRTIPVTVLQTKAITRLRDHQRQLKAGTIKGVQLTYEIALLIELLGWFKYVFFSWVDKPPCEKCGGATEFERTGVKSTAFETCTVEIYRCMSCRKETEFPRYNDPRVLLRTRRGRCGEWANCFALVCRSLNYDTRYVLDTTDHVWCEVFDPVNNRWLHIDPCENKLDTPLMYCHGWGKKLSYVIAFSKDDLQDVTWRYTMDHKEVLKRRKECTEGELIDAILKLREHRQTQVSEAFRKYLTKRALQELVEMMVERKPTDSESFGRLSGSEAWRADRGELGRIPHEYVLGEPGEYTLRYNVSSDKYCLSKNGVEISAISEWAAGAYESVGVFRKVENDWKMAYLAREENASVGSVTWRMRVQEPNVQISLLRVRALTARYESGTIQWKITFDDAEPLHVKVTDESTEFQQRCSTVSITATLSGGRGDVAWQHAQLFRMRLDENAPGLEITATVVPASQ